MKLINLSSYDIEIKSEKGNCLILMPEKMLNISGIEKKGEINQNRLDISLENNTLIIRKKD